MTREEAIDLLDNLIGMIEDNHESDYDTAFKMAIQALSQELCEDAISRSGAIRAIEERAKRIKNEDTLNGLAGAVGILFELPSVNPQEPKPGHWILDDTDNSITCDKCGCLIWANDISNGDAHYCPNCGCRMFEPQESEDKE